VETAWLDFKVPIWSNTNCNKCEVIDETFYGILSNILEQIKPKIQTLDKM